MTISHQDQLNVYKVVDSIFAIAKLCILSCVNKDIGCCDRILLQQKKMKQMNLIQISVA